MEGDDLMNAQILTDGDDRFRKMVTRLKPSQLGSGEVALSENGRMDEGGAWQVREGYENVSGVTLSTTNAAILREEDTTASLFIVAAQSSCTATALGDLVQVTCPADHGMPFGHTSTINLSGFTGAGADINGNREVTYGTGTDQFKVTVSGAGGPYSTGVIGAVKLETDPIAIQGSCLFSDPDDSNIDYIIIADNSQATAIKVSDLSQTTIAYPSGETLGQECDMIQEFDNVVLRQKGKTSWYFDPDDGSTGFGGTPAFVKFGTGSGTQHSIFDTTGNTAIASGVATVTETNSLSAGDKLLIVDADDYDFLDGTTVEVATATTANFTYYVNAETDTQTSIVYSTEASLGGGFVNPPGVAWGIYHQRRSWVPYNYDSESTPAHRGVEDEIIASDLLSHVYDPISNQFRISGGTADYVVGMHPFDDDRLLVFNRNSIHSLRGVSGSLGDVRSIRLTGDIGCVARKSIVSHGSRVYMLGDEGIYALEFLDEFNLRGTEIPLSESVDSLIRRINPGAADKTVGIYHDSRLWWAIPIDGADLPNAIIVYNLFNEGWESLDTTGTTNTEWSIQNLIEAKSGKINELYAVTYYGGVHQLTRTNRDQDLLAATVGQSSDKVVDIPAALTTRQYNFGDLRRKKFNRARIHIQSDSGFATQGDLSAIIEDPDQTVDLGSVRDEFSGGLAANETGTLHVRMGNPRGFASQIKFTQESGRAKIQAVQVDAVSSFESTTSAS